MFLWYIPLNLGLTPWIPLSHLRSTALYLHQSFTVGKLEQSVYQILIFPYCFKGKTFTSSESDEFENKGHPFWLWFLKQMLIVLDWCRVSHRFTLGPKLIIIFKPCCWCILEKGDGGRGSYECYLLLTKNSAQAADHWLGPWILKVTAAASASVVIKPPLASERRPC